LHITFIIIFLDSPRDGQNFSKIHFERNFYVHLSIYRHFVCYSLNYYRLLRNRM